MAPVLSIAAGLVLGAALAASAGGGLPSGALATLAMALGTLVALGARRSAARPRAWAVAALGAVAAIAGAASIPARASGPDPRGVARVRGEVVELRASRDRADAIVRVQGASAIGERSIAPEPGSRIRIRDHAAVEGASVAGTVALAPAPGFTNPSPHPRWPAVDPPRADARAIALASEGGSWIGHTRAHVRRALGATLEEPAAGIARALVLGDLALGEDDGAIVRDAGLSHVLAVSGMHVTLLIGAIVWLLRRAILRVPAIAQRLEAARVACAIGIPLALLYAPLAGEVQGRPLRVGELAKRTGKTVRALHLYEEIGLLEPARRSESGYRLYSPDSVIRVEWIGRLQDAGLSLPEIRELLRTWGSSASAPGAIQKVTELYARKLQETRAQIARLRDLESELERSLGYLATFTRCEPASEP